MILLQKQLALSDRNCPPTVRRAVGGPPVPAVGIRVMMMREAARPGLARKRTMAPRFAAGAADSNAAPAPTGSGAPARENRDTTPGGRRR